MNATLNNIQMIIPARIPRGGNTSYRVTATAEVMKLPTPKSITVSVRGSICWNELTRTRAVTITDQ